MVGKFILYYHKLSQIGKFVGKFVSLTESVGRHEEKRKEVNRPCFHGDVPENTRRRRNVGLTLGHCLRHKPNIKTTLRGCLIFTRYLLLSLLMDCFLF